MRETPIEILERKIFTAKSREQIIATLKSIPQEYFINSLHYNYYKRYIRPKLTLREEVDNLLVEYVIIFTEHYIVLIIRYIDKSQNCYNCIHIKAEYIYLFGENIDGKLFVNKLDPYSLSVNYYISSGDSERVFSTGNIHICRDSDRIIREVLGFDYDVDYDFNSTSELVITDRGRYRVQGEIVLEVIHGYPLDWILYDIRKSDILRSIYVERIAWILVNAGFSVRVSENNEIVIPGVLKSWKQTNQLCDAVRHVIENVMGLKSDGYILRGNEREFIVECYVSKRLEEKYSDLVVSVHGISDQLLEAMIRNDIREQVNKLTPQDVSITLGRHHIELRNVIPTRLVYTPPEHFYIGLVEPPQFEIDLGSFLVNEDSEVTLKHPEHGEVKIRFSRDLVNSGPIHVEFTTTRVARDYTSEQNQLAMKRVLSEIQEIQDTETEV